MGELSENEKWEARSSGGSVCVDGCYMPDNHADISGIGVSLIYGWNYHQCGYCDSACYSSGASSDMESARPL